MAIHYNEYSKHLYTGINGIAMRLSHIMLSAGVKNKYNKHILEIGGGLHPHCNHFHLKGVDSYTISDTAEIIPRCKNVDLSNVLFHNYDTDNDYSQLKDLPYKFTRLVISHAWEHVQEPEHALLNWVSLLDDDALISIAIPCDPGIVWRLGQIISRRKAFKNFQISPREYDLLMSREHINSAQNLIKILKYYDEETLFRFIPFAVPVVEINLFCIMHAKASNIRSKIEIPTIC